MDSELLSLKVQGSRSTHEFHLTCHMIAVTCIGCFDIQIVAGPAVPDSAWPGQRGWVTGGRWGGGRGRWEGGGGVMLCR